MVSISNLSRAWELGVLLSASCALFACTCSGSSGGTDGADAAAGGGDSGADAVDVESDALEAQSDSLPDVPMDGVVDAAGLSVVPEWETLSGTVAGCEIQRLTNAAQLQVFEWEPCDGIEACERTRANKHVLSEVYGAGWGLSQVTDADGPTRVGLVAVDPAQKYEAVYYTTDEGQALGDIVRRARVCAYWPSRSVENDGPSAYPLCQTENPPTLEGSSTISTTRYQSCSTCRRVR